MEKEIDRKTWYDIKEAVGDLYFVLNQGYSKQRIITAMENVCSKMGSLRKVI